ncbi:MAG: 4Fe-4S binding protein [Spirochaetales bacterium]|nr:4Fe-4S binding protein [Spirochaetales bacterium]
MTFVHRHSDTVFRYLLVFALGFFALGVQSILFREFLVTCEGSELAIGMFFFSWLLWVSVGALLGRITCTATPALLRHFEFFPFLYAPAYVLQQFLFFNARPLAGIEAFDLFPIFRMFPVTLIACAPVSLCTGLFFTLSCRWIAARNLEEGQTGGARIFSVPLVYIMEVSGNVAGGVAVTFLLMAGLTHETVFLVSCLVLAAGSGGVSFVKKHFVRAALPFLAIALILVSGTGSLLSEWKSRTAWERLLPSGVYGGRFATPQTEYLYGTYGDQSIVMTRGSVCESFPNDLYGAEVAAVHLVQNPEARRVLVIGQGAFPVCLAFLKLPGIHEVTWITEDPPYAEHVLDLSGGALKRWGGKLVVPDSDIRQVLDANDEPFDIVICHLREASTLVLNRYYTQEFYESIGKHLHPRGIFSVGTPGGENFLGSETARLGASIFYTLKTVFPTILIIPGDRSWLCASANGGASGEPDILEKRYMKADGLESLFPLEGLLKVYRQDRAAMQREHYEEVIGETGRGLLLNTRSYPKALLHGLVFSAKQMSLPFPDTESIDTVIRFGTYLLAGGILLAGLLRFVYRLAERKAPGGKGAVSEAMPGCNRVDNAVLLFSQGVTGISTSILLMFVYQSFFGSVFLHIGLLSAAFLLGLCLGSILTRRYLLKKEKEPRTFLPSVILGHMLLLFLVPVVSDTGLRLLIVPAILSGGIVNGAYIPIVAFRFHNIGMNESEAGSAIEFLDHTGGAAGGIASGVFLLPLFGVHGSAVILVCLLAINLIPAVFAIQHGKAVNRRDVFDRIKRPVSYALFGVGLFMLTGSMFFRTDVNKSVGDEFERAARELTGEDTPRRMEAVREDGKRISYYTAGEGVGKRYVFHTDDFAAGVSGYGGPIAIAVMIDEEGILRGFRITSSNETPEYLRPVMERLPALIFGRNVVKRDSIDTGDATTGATMTGEAIILTITRAAREFAGATGLFDAEEPVRRVFRWDVWLPAIVFPLFVFAALVLRKRPSVWGRRVFLLTIFFVSGVLFNIQYSAGHIVNLADFIFRPVLTVSLFFIVGIPVIVVLFGNIYCGYLCPFGALQEVIGELRPARIKSDPDKRIYRLTRYIKYIMLFLIVMIAATASGRGCSVMDPLVTAFGGVKDTTGFAIIGGLLFLSFFYRRFFCRNLCPAGAFLSLLGRIRLIRFLVPRIVPGFCDCGVGNANESDCLCCDRCRIGRYVEKEKLSRASRGTDTGRASAKRTLFAGLVFLFAVVLVAGGLLFSPDDGVSYTGTGEPRQSDTQNDSLLLEEPPAGRGGENIRDDTERIEELIRNGRLSGHEALYYRKLGR